MAGMSAAQNEAFSRVLIDRALEFSEWNLLDPHQVRFELNTVTGRADYLLAGGRGPLCVLEAKREDVDPYDAREQGRGYAENLRAPFIILSNGREHWFWNYTRADQDAYRIERLPSPEDLERLRLKNLQPPRPLLSEVITPDWLRSFKSDLTLRRYQIIAIDTLCRLFDNKRLRKFLLEMATGTGKTLLCAALIRAIRGKEQAPSAPIRDIRGQFVWFYDLTADGFSLDDKRTPIEANDIPDVLAKWPAREEGPNSYRVPIEKIRENDWSLAAARYKPVTATAVNHDAPADILGDVLKLENDIVRRGNALLKTLTADDAD